MTSTDLASIRLTDEQRAVVHCVNHPVLVLAMVGSGKTLTMAERLRYAIESGTVAADRTLCLTFTNRAARQIQNRVAHRLGEQARAVFCATFHRFCAEVLRRDGDRVGIPREYMILDDVDGPELLREIAEQNLAAFDKDVRRAARSCWELLSRVKLKQHSLDDSIKDILNTMASEEGPSPHSFGGPDYVAQLLRRYDRALSAASAVDFSDLIRYVRHLFYTDDACRRYWAERFQWIQVDEVQDTHLAEYAVLEMLARDHGQLSFFGDIAQTIYEWRGSCPRTVLRRYKEAFKPKEFTLSYNFRSTKTLVDVAARLLRRYAPDLPAPKAPSGSLAGDPVVTVAARAASEQARVIAQDIRQNKLDPRSHKAVVLTRTRRHAEEVAGELQQAGIQVCLVDRFEFFRRKEIKDALALLRLIANPFDSWSARRLLRSLKIGVGDRTLKQIVEQGRSCYVRLCDLLMARTWQHGEPFAPLLARWRDGSVVVLDVETTGLDPNKAEVIEFFGTRVQDGKIVAELHLLFWPIEGRIEGQDIHGLTEDELRAGGTPPPKAFRRIAEFLQGVHIVGHNVSFDLDVLRSHARRCGIALPEMNDWDDTRELARRVLPNVERYDLRTLAETLELSHRPSHRAKDDVYATVQLARQLLVAISLATNERRTLLEPVAENVGPTAAALDQLRSLVWKQPPAQLLADGLQLIGLDEVYKHDPERWRHLSELVEHIVRFQGGRDIVPSRPLVQEVLHTCALVRNVELTMIDEGLPVLPVHQVKGMEFDTVYVAGLHNGLFPLCRRGNGAEDGRHWDAEEERIFYVAATRPKRRLILLGDPDNEFIKAVSENGPREASQVPAAEPNVSRPGQLP